MSENTHLYVTFCFKIERTALYLQLVEIRTSFLEVSLFRIA